MASPLPRCGLGSVGWAVAAVQSAIFILLNFLQIPPPPTVGSSSGQAPPVDVLLPHPQVLEYHCAPCPSADDLTARRNPAKDAPTADPAAPVESWGRPWIAFRAWAVQRGVVVHPGIEMQDFGHGRARGIYAAVAIAPNSSLVSVPVSAMLTVPGCLRDSRLAAAARRLGTDKAAERGAALLGSTGAGVEESFWQRRREEWREEDTTVLDSVALSLCLLEASVRGPSSPWAPWVAVLPQSSLGTVLAMPAEEIDVCLGSSNTDVRDAAMRWRKQTHADFLLLARELPEMKKYSYESYEHWRILVGSRTHGLRIPNAAAVEAAGGGYSAGGVSGEAAGLVPFADMFNHRHQGRTAHWKYEAESQSFVVRAGVSGISVGEEVTVSYGVKSDEEMFLFYGFSDPEASRETTLYLDVDTRRDPLAWEKRDLLMSLGLYRSFKLKSSEAMSKEDLAAMVAAARIAASESEAELKEASSSWEPLPASSVVVNSPSASPPDPASNAASASASMVLRPVSAGLEARAFGFLAAHAQARAQNAGGDSADASQCSVFRGRGQELYTEIEAFAGVASAGLPGKDAGDASVLGAVASDRGVCKATTAASGLAPHICKRAQQYADMYAAELRPFSAGYGAKPETRIPPAAVNIDTAAT